MFTSRYIFKIIEGMERKRSLYPIVHGRTIHKSEKAAQCQQPISECMDNQNVIYTHSRVLFSLTKQVNSDARCNTDELFECDMHSARKRVSRGDLELLWNGFRVSLLDRCEEF